MLLPRLEKQLERFHPLSEKKLGSKLRLGLETAFLPSSLQGDRLLDQSAGPIDDQILKFLIENVAAGNLPWTKSPGSTLESGN